MSHDDGSWIKATASNGGGDCVQMRQVGTNVQVRDSKLGPGSPIHDLSGSSFAAWVAGAKGGQFDSLSEPSAG